MVGGGEDLGKKEKERDDGQKANESWGGCCEGEASHTGTRIALCCLIGF